MNENESMLNKLLRKLAVYLVNRTWSNFTHAGLSFEGDDFYRLHWEIDKCRDKRGSIEPSIDLYFAAKDFRDLMQRYGFKLD